MTDKKNAEKFSAKKAFQKKNFDVLKSNIRIEL